MKKILIITYILSALLISGFARAESVGQQIRNIQYRSGTWQIKVLGQLSNPCMSQPKVVLVDTKNPDVFTLKVVAAPAKGMCVAMIGRVFELPIDLRQLISQSDLQIEVNHTYIIRAENYDFEIAFDGKDILIVPPSSPIELQGIAAL